MTFAFQLIKFGIIGISNVILDFSTYVFLTRFFSFWTEHFIAANIFATAIAASWSFFWNKRWTFRMREGNARHQYVQFLVVNVFGMGINSGILYCLIRFFGVFDLVAKAIGVVVVFFFAFLAHKYWTFRDNESEV